MMGHQTVGGYLAGPSNFIIDPAGVGDDTGTVEIKGSLQVNGTTTTVNSATLDVADLNITVAKGAANAGAADGAGLTVDGANATLTYDSANDRWAINKSLAGDIVGNVTGNVTGTVSDLSNFSTTDLAEGTNLYYTDQRADIRATLRVTAADIGNLNNVDETGVADGKILKYNSTSSKWEVADDAGGISHLHEDTTPELGGDLDTAGFHITFGNNEKAKFGTGGDLEIYHSGSDSFIDDAGTGSIFIRSGTTYFQNAAGTKTSIQTNAGAGQTLFFNNTPVFVTSSTGVDVTGIIQGASDAELKTSPIRIHSNTINTNTTVASTENAVSGGPITIASGVTVTVSGDWTVV